MSKSSILLILIVVAIIAIIATVSITIYSNSKTQRVKNYPVYAQPVSSGEFEKISDSKYTLKLSDVPRQAIYLSTDPKLIFGHVQMDKVLEQTDFSKKPRAILELFPENNILTFFVLEISQAKYDPENKTLEYEVEPLFKYCEDANAFLVDCPNENLPENFDTATLFVENPQVDDKYCTYSEQENCQHPLTPPTCALPHKFEDEQPICPDESYYSPTQFGDSWFCCIN